MQANLSEFGEGSGNSIEFPKSGGTGPKIADLPDKTELRRSIPEADGSGAMIGPDPVDVRRLPACGGIAPSDLELLAGHGVRAAIERGYHPDDAEPRFTEPIDVIGADLEELHDDQTTDEIPNMRDTNDDTTTETNSNDDLQAVTDGGQVEESGTVVLDAETLNVSEHGGESIIIISSITSLISSVDVLEGEISSSGKTIAVEPKHGGKTRRLDTETILRGDSEFRDSKSYEIYTPGRFRARQRSNHVPGPQAGVNNVSEAEDLPEPSHWPALEDVEDTPNECPGCGAVEAPYQTKNMQSPRCEACGETLESIEKAAKEAEEPDPWPSATDMQTWERAGVIETPDNSLMLTRLRRSQGFDTVLRAEAVDESGKEWEIRTDPHGRLILSEIDPTDVVFMRDDLTFDDGELNYAGRDVSRLRTWIRDRHGDRDGDGGISDVHDDDDGSGGAGGSGDTAAARTRHQARHIVDAAEEAGR